MLDGEADQKVLQLLDSVGRGGFAFAWQMLRNREDALDVVQAALAAAWRNRRRLRGGPELRGWFYRVLRNRCIDLLRSRRAQRSATLAHDAPERVPRSPLGEASRREELARLRRVLEEMDEQMREIILLRDFHDLSYRELAAVLGVPPGTVMSRLHRARCLLRQRMLAQE